MLRFESVEVVRSTRSTTKSGTQTLGLPRNERSRGDKGQVSSSRYTITEYANVPIGTSGVWDKSEEA